MIDFGTIADTIVNLIVALGAIFAGVYGCSKKFRAWINEKLKSTDSIKDLDDKQSKLNQRADSFEDHCNKRSSELTQICDSIKDMLTKLDDRIDTLDTTIQKIENKVEKDKESTILTLKYEILDICSRANRYNGITNTDKLLLCELYHEYVDIWKENHYVKSEADKVIKTFNVIDEYKR